MPSLPGGASSEPQLKVGIPRRPSHHQGHCHFCPMSTDARAANMHRAMQLQVQGSLPVVQFDLQVSCLISKHHVNTFWQSRYSNPPISKFKFISIISRINQFKDNMLHNTRTRSPLFFTLAQWELRRSKQLKGTRQLQQIERMVKIQLHLPQSQSWESKRGYALRLNTPTEAVSGA